MNNYQHICRICNTKDNHPLFIGREMMFGSRDEFEYFQCNYCGCLQIAEFPKNIDQYYPSDYAPHTIPANINKVSNWLVRMMQKQRCRTALFQKHFKLNSILKLFVDIPSVLHAHPNDVTSIGHIIKMAGIKDFDEPILDVGCGIYSHWLASLEELGFTSLLGIDPLIPGDWNYGRVKIARSELSGIPGKFSLITLHHSLEHIYDQQDILFQIEQHLTDDGVCLIRIPIVSSQVWEEYGTHWVEMDPPRHLYLHSLKSLELLAGKVGLEVFSIEYDTSAFEFYGSEMYARNISWNDDNSPLTNSKSTLFTKEEMEGFKVRANEVNQRGRAGRAGFFLRKISS